MTDVDPDGERTAHDGDDPHEPTLPLAPVRRADSESRTTAEAAPRVAPAVLAARPEVRSTRGSAEPRGLPAPISGRAAAAPSAVDPDEETAFAAPIVDVSFVPGTERAVLERAAAARALALGDALTATDGDLEALDGLDTLTGHPPVARAGASPGELASARVAAEVRAALQRAGARADQPAPMGPARIPVDATDRAPIIVAERTDPDAAPWSRSARAGVDTPLPVGSREAAAPSALGIAAMVTVPAGSPRPDAAAIAPAATVPSAPAPASAVPSAPVATTPASTPIAAPTRAPKVMPPADDTVPMRVPSARSPEAPRGVPAAMTTAPLSAPKPQRRWDPVTIAAAVMVALAALLVVAVRFIR